MLCVMYAPPHPRDFSKSLLDWILAQIFPLSVQQNLLSARSLGVRRSGGVSPCPLIPIIRSFFVRIRSKATQFSPRPAPIRNVALSRCRSCYFLSVPLSKTLQIRTERRAFFLPLLRPPVRGCIVSPSFLEGPLLFYDRSTISSEVWLFFLLRFPLWNPSPFSSSGRRRNSP